MVSSHLRRDRNVCVTDATGDVGALNSLPPSHVALISTQLGDDPIKGFEVLQSLRSSSPKTRVVMLLDSSRRDMVVQSFCSGARGVFCRSDALKLLPKCVHSVHSNQIWANSQQLEFLVDALSEAPATNLVGAEGEALLSAREQQVVRFLAEGLSNRDIAKQLKLSEHTIKNYMFRIFNKLGVSTRVEVVLYAASQRPSHKAERSRNGIQPVSRAG
jgi:DNA-binding NarL/FixJ family response regulator